MAGIEDQHIELETWRSFYGLDFSALGEAWRKVAAQQCAIRRSLLTDAPVLLDLDLYRVSAQEWEFAVPFRLEATRSEATEVFALVSWFTVGFFNVSRPGAEGAAVKTSELTTHPDATCTHWQQTFMFLRDMEPLSPGGVLKGTMEVRKAEDSPRDLSVRVALDGREEERFTVVGAEC